MKPTKKTILKKACGKGGPDYKEPSVIDKFKMGFKVTKDNVINKTSDIMADTLFGRNKANKEIKQSNEDVKTLKDNKWSLKVPQFDYKDNPQKDVINSQNAYNDVVRRLKSKVKNK